MAFKGINHAYSRMTEWYKAYATQAAVGVIEAFAELFSKSDRISLQCNSFTVDNTFFGDDDINGEVESAARDRIGEERGIADADLKHVFRGKMAIIVAFTVAETEALAVVRHSGNNADRLFLR